MKKFALTTIMSLIALLAITTSGITPSLLNTYVQAADTQPINAQAINDHECNTDEWHFVITQIDEESNAPAFITVFWGSTSEDVPLDKVTGGTAHYSTTSHLDLAVTSATATIYSGWSGQFNLSHGPCDVPTTTPTQEVTPSVSLTPTTEVTPTEVTTPTTEVTPTEKVSESPTPSTSSGPTATPPACEGASCNTGGNSPTPTQEVTPSVSVTPTTNPSTSSRTASATAAPTATTSNPTATASNAAAAPTNTPGIGGVSESTSPVASTSSGPTERVLGATAMANTGASEAIAMTLMGMLGALLLGAGYLSYKRDARS